MLLLNLALLIAGAYSQSTPLSPCPNVFSYEPPGSEPGRWYGVVNLSTDSTLHSLWLNVVLDAKADILGNWIGDVTTSDNIDFKIENTQMKIHPGPATAVRFFVQYNQLNKVPRLQAIRLNGREICNANNGVATIDRQEVVETRPEVTTSGRRPDTQRPPTRQETRPQDRPVSRPQERPQDNRPQDVRPQDIRPQDVRPQDIRPEDRPSTRPVQGSRPGDSGPVYVPTQNPPIDQSNANPYSIDSHAPSQSTGTQTVSRPQTIDSRPKPDPYRPLTTSRPKPSTTTTTRYDQGDFVDEPQPDDSEYFSGGLITIVTGDKRPSGNNFYDRPDRNQQNVCGKVVRNSNPNPLVVNGKPTLEGQWPWQIALYQTQTVDNKYICGGTLVSHRHIVTAAHCVTRKGSALPSNSNTMTVYLGKHNLRTSVEGVQFRFGSALPSNSNTMTVYLGKHNLRTSVEGVQFRFVSKIRVHPAYNASSFGSDLAVLELREDVQYTDWVRPACLWPDSQIDLSNVIGKKGSVVGWGFDDKGVATEELTLIEMPVVDQETCLRSYSDFFSRYTSEYTYCAGYRDGTSVCNGDSGGGMVFNLQGTWYLRGLVSLSVARQNQYRCDPTHYVVFTDLAKFNSWIQNVIA